MFIKFSICSTTHQLDSIKCSLQLQINAGDAGTKETLSVIYDGSENMARKYLEGCD